MYCEHEWCPPFTHNSQEDVDRDNIEHDAACVCDAGHEGQVVSTEAHHSRGLRFYLRKSCHSDLRWTRYPESERGSSDSTHCWQLGYSERVAIGDGKARNTQRVLLGTLEVQVYLVI